MVDKPNRFKINRPALDEEAVKKFAAAAEVIPEDKLVKLKGDNESDLPEQQKLTKEATIEQKDTAISPKAKQKPVTDKNKKNEPSNEWPWSGIDDKTARTTGYTVQFPASVYAKIKFLGENEPGGPSVKKIVMEALEVHLEKKLAKYKKTNPSNYEQD